MKCTNFLSIITLLLGAQLTQASEGDRYITVVANPMIISTNGGNGYGFVATNSLEIADFEFAEVVSILSEESNTSVTTIKGGVRVQTGGGLPKVAGPATLEINAQGMSAIQPAIGRGALMTVKISPTTYTPQKAVTVAPGMGSVQIEMETSTNLLTWAIATNGVYNDDLRFFRVKLTKLNP